MKIDLTKDYIKARAAEYPALPAQLDILYHQGFDAWKKVIADVKLKFPKPSDTQTV